MITVLLSVLLAVAPQVPVPEGNDAIYLVSYTALIEEVAVYAPNRGIKSYCVGVPRSDPKDFRSYMNPEARILERLGQIYSNVHGVQQCEVGWNSMNDGTRFPRILFRGEKASILEISNITLQRPDRAHVVAGTLDESGGESCTYVLQKIDKQWKVHDRKDCSISCY